MQNDPLKHCEGLKLQICKNLYMYVLFIYIYFFQYAAVRTLGGTGALRIALDFLHGQLGCETAYVSNPTWGKLWCRVESAFSTGLYKKHLGSSTE